MRLFGKRKDGDDIGELDNCEKLVILKLRELKGKGEYDVELDYEQITLIYQKARCIEAHGDKAKIQHFGAYASYPEPDIPEHAEMALDRSLAQLLLAMVDSISDRVGRYDAENGINIKEIRDE